MPEQVGGLQYSSVTAVLNSRAYLFFHQIIILGRRGVVSCSPAVLGLLGVPLLLQPICTDPYIWSLKIAEGCLGSSLFLRPEQLMHTVHRHDMG